MCTSLVIWYIVDGHPAGVIVFIFLSIFIDFYFVLRYPRFVVIAIISIVTQGEPDPRFRLENDLTFQSLDHWVRIGSEEDWRSCRCFLA